MRVSTSIRFLLLVATGANLTSGAEVYTQFNGQKTGDNSWFDGTLWPEHGVHPDQGDSVTMNNPDTYCNVDTGNARVLSLTVAESATNVELEVSQANQLLVDSNVIVGENMGSTGKIVVGQDAQLVVGGALAIGGGGAGNLQVKGGKVSVDGEFSIGTSGSVELTDSAELHVQGNHLNAFQSYLGNNQVVPNNGMETYAILDVTKNMTIVRGTAASDGGGGGGGGGSGTVRSYSCPASGETVMTYQEGDVLDLAKSSNLCTLVEVRSAGLTGSSVLGLKPVGRSYSGNDWENYSGPYGASPFDCSSGSSCQISPPVPPEGNTYILKTYATPSFTTKETSARFLEKGTFGPRRSEIDSFTSPEEWVSTQLKMSTITSHRAFFRERVTHWHTESTYHNLLHTEPCNEGARYRKYAFIPTDNDRFIKIETSTVNASKAILSIDGVTRTIADKPIGWGGSSTVDGVLSDGEYEVCSFRDLEGVHTEVRIIPFPGAGCKDLWVGGIYGNPPIQFDDDHLPDNPTIDLDGNFVHVLDERFVWSDAEHNLLQLTSAMNVTNCPNIVAGAPEAAYIGTTSNGGDVEYWIHSPSLMLMTNTLDQPLIDGGKAAITKTESAPFERMRAVCSNAPRTFLNEDYCVLSDEGCMREEGDDVDILLNTEHLELMHTVTGGPGGQETKYVYAAIGQRNDPDEGLPSPCTPNARSRWVPIANCTGGPTVQTDTQNAFVTLLRFSSDQMNPFLRDIFFFASGTTCNPLDVNTFDFKVNVDGQCWQNVHPDYLNVYVFNYWVDKHPGGPDKIKQFADVNQTFYLTFPSWHSMDRWNKNAPKFPFVGRLGDTTTFKNLPEELRREDIAQAFGADPQTAAATRSVMVCGSPYEVASIHDTNSGPRVLAGFDMFTEYNQTSSSTLLREQRRSIWMYIAMHAPDQLRQRVAHALSQILVVSPGAIGDSSYTESFLSYYDIFVRHAFGNYLDILREVTYHPLMAEMLTYINGESTGYAWTRRSIFQKADENYAREIMQLFTFGLYKLNIDGTRQVDANGNEIRTYTNRDIAEYAKVYTGFIRQSLRGNIEDPRKPTEGGDNQIDPVVIDPEEKDHFPKLGLDRQYIGDGYPLCTDLPSKHFLKKGATYRLLGSNPKPDLLFDRSTWTGSAPKRLYLTNSSSLASVLCYGNITDCKPTAAKFVLEQDLPCDGQECDVIEPRSLNVAPGIWYEYVRPACVKHAFFDNPRTIRRRSFRDKYMCGNPESLDASTLCCDSSSSGNVPWRYELFAGERVPFNTAFEDRCIAENGLRLCADAAVTTADCSDPLQGGCDYNNIFYWLQDPCTLAIKIDLEGGVAIIHQHGLSNRDDNDNYKMVQSTTKMFFRADWESDDILESFLSDYTNNCAAMNCTIDVRDGLCQCGVSVETTQLFLDDAEVTSIDNILSKATIGAFEPTVTGEPVPGVADAITKYPAGNLNENTVFEFKDSFDRTLRRKNVVSKVSIGNGNLKIRNPVGFFALSEFNTRDARYELDAALDQYFYHKSTAPFIAIRLAQRFGISNPSPRYVQTIATAFQTGLYQGIGSGKYGCLNATIAAVLLDRESLDPSLDADPAQGSLFEPYLKIVKLMRSLEFQNVPQAPFTRFERDIQDSIGQEVHKTPSVFSFFRPEYRPSGRINTAQLVSPESQVLNGPMGINLLNMMISLIKYGLNDCYGGFGDGPIDTDGWASADCQIGSTTNYGAMTYNASTLNLLSANEVVDDLATLLTSGRLTEGNRQIVMDAFDYTISQGFEFFEAVVNAQQLIAVSPEYHTSNIPAKTGQNRTTGSSGRTATNIPYKSVVFLMLAGGADSFNILVPNQGACTGMNALNMTVDEQYQLHRGVMAFDPAAGEYAQTITATDQPCSSFALHDELSSIKQLYDDGDVIFFANTGVVNQNDMTRSDFNRKTRTQLFAHNAMQEETKKVDPYDTEDGTGVLGRARDVLEANGHVVDAINIDQSSIALEGVPGAASFPFVVPRNGVNTFAERPTEDLRSWVNRRGEEYFPMEDYTALLNGKVDGFSGMFAEHWSDTIIKGISDGAALKNDLEVLANSSAAIWESAGPYQGSNLGQRLKVVSELMQTHDSRKTDRDMFYVEFDGFDHHNDMKANLRPKMSELNANINRFVQQLKENGQWESTVIYITSEFARTITPNSNQGSDHGKLLVEDNDAAA